MATHDWNNVRGSRPLDENLLQTHRRLIHAEKTLRSRREGAGIDDRALERAVNAVGGEEADEILMPTLAHFVTELGGYVEIRAVFPDETVTLVRDPDPGSA